MHSENTLLQPDKQYQEFLAQGRFMIQRSRVSGRSFFYPRVAEPGTGCTDLEWYAPSGLGTVYAVTVIAPRPPTAPYNVALIDLDEGARMMSRVEGVPPEQVRIGMAVRARITREADGAIVVFDPVDAGGTPGAAAAGGAR